MNKDPFKEYIRESKPDKRDKGYAWHTAIGLQAVDGLEISEYLLRTAIRNIEGEISFEEADALLQSYYEENPACEADGRTEEADKVSARIAAILSEKAFSFTPNEYLAIHRKLFSGIYPHAGRIRDYNITKKEWVLDGATVIYGSATELSATLEYDFSEEKKYSYKGLSMDEIIYHLSVFISALWQIHVFGEGNTRTTAVFFIKYLRTLGFDVTNDIFAENAWYFRNALVRANYNDLKNGIHETTEFLEVFLRNLLLNENHPLHNRALHISGTFKIPEKANIEDQKANIENRQNQLFDFFREIDKEKFIARQTLLTDGERRENDAEHAWHMAIMTILLSEYANEKIDVLRTVAMLLIHDIVEIDAGDTYAYDEEGKKTQRARELAAADRIFSILPEDWQERFRGLWDEFEAWETPEAKFAHTMDCIQPMMLNDATDGKSWVNHGVKLSQILGRNAKTAEGSEALWEYAREHFIKKNVEKGRLKKDI